MFEIYLCCDGPVLVEEQQQICILHVLSSKSLTFPEIVCEVSFTEQEVSSGLESLVQLKLIKQDGSITGGKAPSFILDAFPLIVASDYGVQTRNFRHPFKVDNTLADDLENWLLYYLFTSTIASGITLAPILSEDNYDLGYRIGCRDESGSDPMDLKPVLDFLEKSGLAKGEVVSKNPLTVSLIPGRLYHSMNLSQHYDMFFSIMLGFLKQRTGRCYVQNVTSHESRSCPYFTVEFHESDSDKLHRNHFSSNIKTCDPGFSLYWNGKEYLPVSSFLQRSILRLLSVRSYTLAGITEHYGIKHEAVSSEVKALEKIGLVKRLKHRKPSSYIISSVKVFDWTKVGEPLADEESKCLDLCIDNPVHYVRYIFHYFLLVSHRLGFDHDILIHFLANRVGSKLITESEGTTVEDILDGLANRVSPQATAEVKIISKSPLTFYWRANFDMSDFIAGRYKIIHDSIMSSILTETSGVPFTTLDSKMGGKGNREYTGSFIQSFKLQNH